MKKKYDMYGLGNALVDMEYHREEERLQSLQIDKGVMTLIDQDTRDALLQKLGEEHDKMACGGSAANSVIALAQLGGSGSFSGQLADDDLGRFYLHDLQQNHVHSNIRLKQSDLPTGMCLAVVTPDADRSMNTFLGVTVELSPQDIDVEALLDSEYLYIEGYLVTPDGTQKTTVEARKLAEQHGVKTSLTLSDLNMVKYFKDGLLNMIGEGVDLLFANEVEAKAISGSNDLGQTLQALKPLSRHCVITRGANGAVIRQGEEIIEITAPRVEAIDTLGAGDMFAGAYLYGITHGMSPEQAGTLATQAASEVVTHFGPRLQAEQTRGVLQKILKN